MSDRQATIGRIVHYTDTQSRVLPAQVVATVYTLRRADVNRGEVRNLTEDEVHLRVQTYQQHGPYRAQRVTYDPAGRPGTWRWPDDVGFDLYRQTEEVPETREGVNDEAEIEQLVEQPRAELNTQAERAGVESPDSLPNKRAVAEKILEASDG